ncbi:MAG: PilZ domain-containing protein [Deltaproteobacteria bacterium]|nr:PilZ domain-containing protein [Deltaproteobacteria bacterium]
MDARTTARFPLELPAIVTTAATEVACTVESLSLGGVFVRGAHLPIDTRVVVQFSLPKRAELEIPCTARWSTPEGTGLQFDGLRAADTYALSRYILAQGNATQRTPIDEILGRLQQR